MAARLKIATQALAVALVGALLALLIWKVSHGSGRKAKLHAPAPNFTLSRLDRPGKLTLATFRGRAVVLNFWASWCDPCKAEAPELEKAWQKWRGRGVSVIGVDAQDFKGDARKFMRRHGITYPVVHDGSGATIGPYGLTGFPETFFVDKRGRIVKHVDGQVSAATLARGIGEALRS